MRCNKCQSEDTKVLETRKHSNGAPIRRRKCNSCGSTYRTLEVLFDGVIPKTEVVKPKVKAAPTKPVKVVKPSKVEVRRKNEDRRDRVPSYFIEDDFDDGRW